MSKSMLEGFALYREPMMPENMCKIHMPIGARLHRIDRLQDAWRLWIATNDFNFGTYMMLNFDGSVETWVARRGEGDEVIFVRPSDDVIRRTWK